MEQKQSMWVVVATALISSTVIAAAISAGSHWYTVTQVSEAERAYARIHETYFAQGLYQVESALSEYGTSLTIALLDVKIEISRLEEKQLTRENVESILQDICSRESIADIVQRNYRGAARSFPRLQPFGMELYDSFKRTLHLYSLVAKDLLAPDDRGLDILVNDIRQDREEFLRSLDAATRILQNTEVYLETRIRHLDNYVYQEDWKTYSDFFRLVRKTPFDNFRQELKEYIDRLDAFREALMGGEEASEARAKSSLALSEWLGDHIDLNPFETIG